MSGEAYRRATRRIRGRLFHFPGILRVFYCKNGRRAHVDEIGYQYHSIGPSGLEPTRTAFSSGSIDTTARPQKLGPYRLDALLGRGGMGEVYKAWDPRLDRWVAVKRLHTAASSPATRRRFCHEARVAAQLGHPAILQVFDVLEDNGWSTTRACGADVLDRHGKWSTDPISPPW